MLLCSSLLYISISLFVVGEHFRRSCLGLERYSFFPSKDWQLLFYAYMVEKSGNPREIMDPFMPIQLYYVYINETWANPRTHISAGN